MNTFHIINLGCKVNKVEADTIAASFVATNWTQAPLESADIIVINTCTVTGEADKKSRKACRQALARNGHAKILVTGCAILINPNNFKEVSSRIHVVPKHEFDDYLKTIGITRSTIRYRPGFNTRVGIKIQDGCNAHCSYCIVRKARSQLLSKPSDEVRKEVSAYFEAGAGEVVLTGINIGAYNDKKHTLSTLLSVLKDLAVEQPGDSALSHRIRLSSIEPTSIDDALISLLATSNGAVCRHLHIPLQSGSSRILSVMERPYTANEYWRLIERIKKQIPSISLSTDVIVGFPGETDSDFQETMELCSACEFSKIHVFPFSSREGTRAAILPEQIDTPLKSQRAEQLRTLSESLRKQDRMSRAGTFEYILAEPTHALSESYHRVKLPNDVITGHLYAYTFDDKMSS